MNRLIYWLIEKISPRFIKNILGSLLASAATFLIVTIGLDPELVAKWVDITTAVGIAVVGYLLGLLIDLLKAKSEK